MTRPVFDARDVEKNRIPGAIGYVLFFVPLIADGSSRYGRFCANQGALGWLAYAAIALVFGVLNFVLGWIPLIGWLIRLAGALIRLSVLALMLYYAWKAYSGKAEALPFIGNYQLIK
ncbi:MAG: hypothetical protein IJE08_16140 [Clostridia bacterium]|nr:hypothetical protein [Clostridia bacterium]